MLHFQDKIVVWSLHSKTIFSSILFFLQMCESLIYRESIMSTDVLKRSQIFEMQN